MKRCPALNLPSVAISTAGFALLLARWANRQVALLPLAALTRIVEQAKPRTFALSLDARPELWHGLLTHRFEVELPFERGVLSLASALSFL